VRDKVSQERGRELLLELGFLSHQKCLYLASNRKL